MRKDYYYDENAPSANSIVVAASAVVTNSLGEILLHKRKDNEMWSLFGGALELGENISQTILREVKEESGYDVKIKKLIGIYSDPKHIIQYLNGEIRQQFSICFHCSIVSGSEKISNESTEIKFFTQEQIHSVKMHQAQLVRINDFLSNNQLPYIK